MLGLGLRQVVADGRYILLAAAMGLAVFILATWLPNLGLVWQIAASASIPLVDKVQVLTALIGSIGTNFTVFSALSTVAIAVLFGANVAMIAYYFRVQRQIVRQAGQVGAATSLGALQPGSPMPSAPLTPPRSSAGDSEFTFRSPEYPAGIGQRRTASRSRACRWARRNTASFKRLEYS